MIFDDKEKIDSVDSENNEDGLSGGISMELDKARTQLNETRMKYVQLLADVENMKKRSAKEHEMQRDALATVLFTDLLLIVDNFDRALAQEQNKDHSSDNALFAGLSMIHASLMDLLKKWGVQEMNNFDQFDPLFHEALMQVESDGKDSGSIAQVLQKGYLINGKVLRPAKVSVVK